ncbi:hypothetical protein [uncultured Sphingomonas sp.]|nr:hypothetical protein [uncultured Sphingomonas sp.]
MNTVTETRGCDGLQEAVVRMYPNNRLKDQLRGVAETFSGFQLLRDSFKA